MPIPDPRPIPTVENPETDPVKYADHLAQYLSEVQDAWVTLDIVALGLTFPREKLEALMKLCCLLGTASPVAVSDPRRRG